jgi:hypothetical protein
MLQILAGDVAAGPQYERIAARRDRGIFSPQHPAWMLRAQADFIEHKACGVAVELPHSTHHFFLRSPRAAAAMIRGYLASPDPCS